MKPLTLEETRLKEEMKERCLAKGQYVDENAKKKFDMLCHLEDFEVQYWELQQENKQLKKVIDMVSARLEYFLIGNLKYQSSQEEFIKLLDILKEVSE